MTWEQRYRLAFAARTALVLWAAVSLAAALAFAALTRWLDQATRWTVFGYTEDGARAVLSTLVGSMLTFIVFVLSATLIVVQLASGQLTPRVIALVLSQRGVKFTLAVLTFTYTYSLVVLGRVDDRVPELPVAVAILLNLTCVLIFFLFVQLFSTGLRPASVVLMVAERARGVIEQVFPVAYNPKLPEQPTAAVLPGGPAQVVEFGGRAGVLMAFGLAQLDRLARGADAVIELVPQVGDSLSPGDPLFRVYGGARPVPPGALRGCVAVGTERTLEQDPRFAFRILVDIANKALSPAINDPTTAVLALDQIDSLLSCLGRRRLDEGASRDAAGRVRVVYGTPDWPDFVTLAVSEIRHYGEGSIQVSRRLRAMLENLIRELPEDRRPPLQGELALLQSAIRRAFPDEADRQRADVADYQGVGGSDS
jgi:uncharacterized membrane protein